MPHPPRVTLFVLLILFMFPCPSGKAVDDLAESRFLLPEYSKKISMDFKKAQLGDVLKIFSQQSGLNFIASQDITGKEITLYLDNVPVEEALERILTANNLTYEIQPGSDIFLVKTLRRPSVELVTRIYPLKYATVSTSKLNQTLATSAGGSTAGASSGGAAAGGGSSLISALRNVMSELGKIIEDPRTNSLIVTDIPSQFPRIEETITRLDVAIPLILIEVEMLDISKSTGDQLGIKYGSTPLSFTGGKRSHYYPWDQNKLIREKRIEFTSSNEFTTGTIDASGLSAVLQFIKSQTDTKNLARPRILTLNNETAEIKISTKEAIGIATNTLSAQSTATQSVTAERVETGVFLNVTPQANLETGEVTIAIIPKVIQARTGGTFGTTTFKDPEERGSKSILVVKTGETIILGGLLRTDYDNTVVKVPFLGDLPFFGTVFRHRDKTAKDRELIIFITPHIISNQAVSAQERDVAARPGIIREQDIPRARLDEIDQALSILEKKKL